MSKHREAFPIASDLVGHAGGLSMREYFAAKAMQVELSALGSTDGRLFDLRMKMAENVGCSLAEIIAHESVAMADALIEALEADK